LKNFNIFHKDTFIDDVINNTITTTESEIVDKAMTDYAERKASIYNLSIQAKLKEYSALLPKFNPASAKQKKEFFAMAGVEPLSTTDKGEPSYPRKDLEKIIKTVTDTDLIEAIQLFIDNSYGAIVKNNFIEAFKRYTIDGVLYGKINLFGAKSFRLTSKEPNLLNMPSTGSIYAKPLKECFIAPTGFVIATADYAALEDRVIANLSKDENKISVFTEHIDGHSLGATYYFKEEVIKLVGDYTDHKKAARELKALVDEGSKEAGSIRQKGKPITLNESVFIQ
jgi:DNA polymerase-1